VLNPSDAEQHMTLTTTGVELAGRGRLWRMAPPSVDATITVDQPPGVQVEEQSLSAGPTTIAAPPFSVTIYALPLQ